MLEYTFTTGDYLILKDGLIAGEKYLGVKFTEQLGENINNCFIIAELLDRDTYSCTWMNRISNKVALNLAYISRPMIESVLNSELIRLFAPGVLLTTKETEYLCVNNTTAIDYEGNEVSLLSIAGQIKFVYANAFKEFYMKNLQDINYDFTTMDKLWQSAITLTDTA